MTFDFRADREAHLRVLCAEMGLSVDEFINKAVLTFMEDYEDVRDGRAAYKEFVESGEQPIALEEIVRRYGLEDYLDPEGREADLQAGPTDSTTDQQLSTRQTTQAA